MVLEVFSSEVLCYKWRQHLIVNNCYSCGVCRIGRRKITAALSCLIFETTKNCLFKKYKAEHEGDYKCLLKSCFSTSIANVIFCRVGDMAQCPGLFHILFVPPIPQQIQISVDQPYAGPAASCYGIIGIHSMKRRAQLKKSKTAADIWEFQYFWCGLHDFYLLAEIWQVLF
jgi:hypothetical protein